MAGATDSTANAYPERGAGDDTGRRLLPDAQPKVGTGVRATALVDSPRPLSSTRAPPIGAGEQAIPVCVGEIVLAHGGST